MAKKSNKNGVLTGYVLLKQIREAAKTDNHTLVQLNDAGNKLKEQVEERGVPVRDVTSIGMDHIHTTFANMTGQAAHSSGVAIKGAIDNLPKSYFGQLQQTARKSGIAKNR